MYHTWSVVRYDRVDQDLWEFSMSVKAMIALEMETFDYLLRGSDTQPGDSTHLIVIAVRS